MSNLLEKLSNSRLPALREPDEPREPSEPWEPREVETRGRTPDEVVGWREERRQYAEREPEESRQVTRPEPVKPRQPEPVEYRAPQQQQAPQAVPAQPLQPITNAMIARVYDAVSDLILNDLIQNDLMEADLIDAYPRGIKTMAGQARFAFDEIGVLKCQVAEILAFLNNAIAQSQRQIVVNNYNAQLDHLAKKDPKLYGGLKDPAIRQAFTQYLVEEVGATIEQSTGEKAPQFLAKQWVAFNSPAIIGQAKRAVGDRRFIGGEGRSSGPGLREEPDLMSRMISNSGRF